MFDIVYACKKVYSSINLVKLKLVILLPLSAIILELGFIMAASADIFCLEIEFPAVISMVAICCTPPTDSQIVMYLSDSMEQDPNLTFSGFTDSGGFTT